MDMRRYLCLIFFASHHVVCIYFTRCYNNNEYCLWTDDAVRKSWSDAVSYCRSNNSVLVTVTNDDTQAALLDFRTYVNASSSTSPTFLTGGVWIDVSTADANSFHWINEPTGQPGVDNQAGDSSFVARRFGAIFYTTGSQRITYYAQEFNSPLSFYICQYTGVDCSGGLTRNSICYRKYNSESVTWFTASNKCLSMNGSLATFSDLTDQNAPKNDKNLTQWLNSTADTKYWIGLVRRWFVTHEPNGTEVDVQYTNWLSAPGQPDGDRKCVLVEARTTTWIIMSCTDPEQNRLVCQAAPPASITTKTMAPTPTAVTRSQTTASPESKSSTQTSNSAQPTDKSPVTSKSSSAPVAVIVGVVVGVGVPLIIIIVVIVLVVVLRHRKKSSHIRRNPSQYSNNGNAVVVGGTSMNKLSSSTDTDKAETPHSSPSAPGPPATKLPLVPECVYADIVPAATINQQTTNGGVDTNQSNKIPSDHVVYSDLVTVF